MTEAERRKEDITTGARLRTRLLLEQADVSLGRATEDAEVLGKRFPEEQRAALGALTAEVRTGFAAQGEAKTDIPAATEALDAAFREGKDLAGDILSAATNAFEDTAPEIVAAFRAGQKTGQSVSRLDAKLTLLVPLAKTHAARLDGWGEPDAEGRLKTAQVTLQAANAAQEKAIEALPRQTADLYERKARLLSLLKKLNRAAQRAFKNEPARRRAYNLDILYRHAAAPAQAKEEPPRGTP